MTSVYMMLSDVFTVFITLYLAIHLGFDRKVEAWLGRHNVIAEAMPAMVLLALVAWFATALLVIGRRRSATGVPMRPRSLLQDQRRTLEACLTAGLLVCAGMYMAHITTVSRVAVFCLVCATTTIVCVVRVAWRWRQESRYDAGVGTRNVLIVGSSHVGEVLRRQIAGNCEFGRVFRGFLLLQGDQHELQDGEDFAGRMPDLRRIIRQQFIDEVILTERCSPEAVIELVELARELDFEVRAIRGFYDDLASNAPVEYMADFPLVPLHRRRCRAVACSLKRTVDIVFSVVFLLLAAPIFLIVAIAVMFDSPGPVFYVSDRVGKKGRIFPCFKFRTMVADAERLKASLAAANERDGILFKMKNDPRITPLGRVLRKYSLDELPQMLNVLRGEMSLVGPRPPLASEVARYEAEHFRRLEVPPGLTGLWQVRARQNPSFEQYVALDLAYVENWNLWLDVKILARTAEVVLRGTGA